MATYFWKILLRRATAAALFAPGGSPLSQGEPAYATDTKQLYVGNGDGTNTAIGGPSALAADTDVALTSPADGQLLTYSAALGKWVNAPPVMRFYATLCTGD